MIRIKVGEQIYNVEIADTEEKMEKGLQDVESMEEDEGMLFVYNDEYDVDFWMKDTDIPLDIVFIGSDFEVISVKQGVPNSEEYISEKDVQYVLEVNVNSGIQKGDEIEFLDDYEYKVNEMYVVGSDGKPQMKLEGGERIISIRETKVLVSKAKKAYKEKTDSTYKQLGKYLFQVLKKQDERKPEYVSK